MITLRDAAPGDMAQILAMNDAVVDVTSPMDADRLRHLMDISSHAVVAETGGRAIAFVIAMQASDPHENENFAWFSARLRNFVYIDRIVIAEDGRGAGLGRALYAHVVEAARQDGCLVMAAEIDLMPPNRQSLGFHEKVGFAELGQRIYESGKTVSMQVKGL